MNGLRLHKSEDILVCYCAARARTTLPLPSISHSTYGDCRRLLPLRDCDNRSPIMATNHSNRIYSSGDSRQLKFEAFLVDRFRHSSFPQKVIHAHSTKPRSSTTSIRLEYNNIILYVESVHDASSTDPNAINHIVVSLSMPLLQHLYSLESLLFS
jgi:hypothetical protein